MTELSDVERLHLERLASSRSRRLGVPMFYLLIAAEHRKEPPVGELAIAK